MTDKQIKLIVGSLLHDIGKVVYRSGDGRNHSQSGYDFLKDEAKTEDADILSCVRYHHAKDLSNAGIGEDSISYITYFADNIAAAVDRREKDEGEEGFDRTVPLETVFNILNGNQEKKHYQRNILDPELGINYPTDKPIRMDESFYLKIRNNILENLAGIELSEEYINSLLSILEANLSYVPSSTSKRELADISLYDHLKITAAAASCIERWAQENQISDLRDKLFVNSEESYKEKMFLLYSMDVSGIQKFIYTIASKGALKSLRARSFYLEILMEHIIDELLDKLSLSRANLIYSGGGHCYMLLPNTQRVKEIVEEQERANNGWFLETFDVTLYVAGGYVECSANDLKNQPEGSYSELYLKISDLISAKKRKRYTADQIRMLNTKHRDGECECKVCHRMAKTDQENRCSVCAALEEISKNILNLNFFVVSIGSREGTLPLPGGKYLTAQTKNSLLENMKTDEYVRCYSKNKLYTGIHVTTKLWVGDYTTKDTFDELESKAEGIKRIGVLRADVDNLGQTFVFGFRSPDGSNRYATLSRTATLSRQLSLFFKCYINQILKEQNGYCFGRKREKNITIVYSGGDDIFLVGSWGDVVEAMTDIHHSLEKYSQGTLTISGGIGLYSSGYPVHIMAKETAVLEETSKQMNGKNAITLFQKEECFRWPEFNGKVINEKYKALDDFFTVTNERGNTFLYHLLELIRNQDEVINRARYVYILSRMEPGQDSSKEQKEAYSQFSKKMYQWMDDEQSRKELILAIYLYVYLHRTEEEEE